jgi:hypothetical protein
MQKSNRFSLFAFLFGAIFLAYASLVYYPKWKVGEGECVLTWDVSGYYFYLPAIFIYKDLKHIEFKDKILKDYAPTPDLQQAFLHKPSGNYVMKYSCGQALQYLPAFLVGHFYAKNSHFSPDGFSKPYQAAIVMWSLLIGIVGLWFARKSLLCYFKDRVVAVTLLLLVLGTNYLNYASIDSAMSHNWCFTLLAILVYSTIKFYESASWKYAIAIGVSLGWAVLARPTELMGALIPLCWGLENKETLFARFVFWRKHYQKILVAAAIVVLFGSIQIAYWKYVTGAWVVYSYEDQGFSWLRPHLKSGMISYKAGWLTYTPLMIFALLGLVALYHKYRNLFFGIFLYTMVVIYVTFAWDVWWYGGSLGQRAMVQSYAVQVFSLAAFVAFLFDFYQKNGLNKIITLGVATVMLFFTYINLWFTHQAHKGGFFLTEQTTKQYYWATTGRWNLTENSYKLLDAEDYFEGEPKEMKLLYENDFNSDSLSIVDGANAKNHILFLDEWSQFSKRYALKISHLDANWVRMSSEFHCTKKEWDNWAMLQMTIVFLKDGKEQKRSSIRPHRLLKDDETKTIFMDVKVPKEPFDSIEMYYYNAEGKKTIYIDNLSLSSFKE